MSEIKYTTDNKKVIVVGKLNAQETIVQEIFISNGNEIPSGENFVVKSLHDTPVVSWKEKNLKEIEDNYDKKRNEIESEKRKLEDTFYRYSKEMRAKIKFMANAVNNLQPKVFETLADYITGQIKFIVKNNTEILTIEEFNQSDVDGELRLISIFGRDDGTMTYAKGQYSDYSGGRTYFIPCKTRKEAISVIEKYLTSDKQTRYWDGDIKAAEKYNIKLKPDLLKVYYEEKVRELEKGIVGNQHTIDSYTKERDSRKEQLKNIKKLLK